MPLTGAHPPEAQTALTGRCASTVVSVRAPCQGVGLPSLTFTGRWLEGGGRKGPHIDPDWASHSTASNQKFDDRLPPAHVPRHRWVQHVYLCSAAMKRPVISDPRGWTTCVIPACRHDATRTAVRSDPDERMPQRGASGVGLDTCCTVDVDPERFEVMVSEALDGTPAELGELRSNVAVTVRHDSCPAGLLGLYQGVPLTRRSTFYAGALPDRITIHRRAICAVCVTAIRRSSSRFGGRSFTRWVINSGSATRGRASSVGASAGHIRRSAIRSNGPASFRRP